MHPTNTGTSWRHTLKRVFAPFSIILICIYVFLAVSEAFHYIYEKVEHKDAPNYAAMMHDSVARQITEVGAVPVELLAHAVNTDLTAFDCTWYFHCSPRPMQTVSRIFFPCSTCHVEVISSQEFVPPKLVLDFRYGPAPIPTLHSIFGMPHALSTAAVKIAAAGPWAIIMFLSCAIIYFGTGFFFLTKAEDHPVVGLFLLFTCSPLLITLLAQLFQMAATKVFWALGQLILAIAYSTAISIAVSIPHVWKARREIVEAVELIRNV